MKLVPKTYRETRRDYFEEQLAAAKRRLKWAVDHNRSWMEIEDDADIVSFYEWAVMMAAFDRRCGDDFCSYGERKENENV